MRARDGVLPRLERELAHHPKTSGKFTKDEIVKYFKLSEGECQEFDAMSAYLKMSPEDYIRDLEADFDSFFKGRKTLDQIDLRIRPILIRTTFDWQGIPRGSRAREIPLLARCATFSAFRSAYRRKFIRSIPLFGQFRNSIATAIAKGTDPIIRDGESIYEWSFVDRIRPKHLDDENSEVDLAQGEKDIQRLAGQGLRSQAVDDIKKLFNFAKSLPSFQYDPKILGKFEKNVAFALHDVAWVGSSFHYFFLHLNSYRR